MIIDEDYQIAPIGSHKETVALEKMIHDLNNDQLLILLLATNHHFIDDLWYDITVFSKWVDEDFFDNVELVAPSKELMKSRFEIDAGWVTKNSKRLYDYITAENKRFLKIHQLRYALVQHLSKTELHNSRIFLLFSAFINEKDLDLYRRNNTDMMRNEWAHFEFIDNQSMISNSQSQPSTSKITNSSIKLIQQYINENDNIRKNYLFWVIKWKLITGNYSSLDLNVLSKSNDHQLQRLIQYLHKMHKLEIIDVIYMEKVLKWPITDFIKTKFQKNFNNDKFSSESPLKKYGYIVGNTSTTNRSDREQILRTLFLFTPREEIGSNWGDMGTPRRLYSITWHIARNIWRVKGRSEYSQAVEDWRSDLNFLKDKFYFDKSVTEFFQWPDVMK